MSGLRSALQDSPTGLLSLYASGSLVHLALQRLLARPQAAWPENAFVPDVYVVVTCYNEDPTLLDHCCASLRDQDYRGRLRVVLVDDASPNRADLEPVYRRYARMPGWTVHRSADNQGKRAAQDTVRSRWSAGDVIVFIDSDTVIATDGIRRIVQPFNDPSVGSATGKIGVLNRRHNLLTRMQGRRYDLLFGLERAAQGHFGAVLCCSGPFSAYRRQVLDEVWEDYQQQTCLRRRCVAGDDLHLTTLTIGKGYKSLYEPSARAWTAVPTTLRQYVRQQRRWSRSFYREIIPVRRALNNARHAGWRGRAYLRLDVLARALLPPLLGFAGLLAVLSALLGIGGSLGPLLAGLAGGMLANAIFLVPDPPTSVRHGWRERPGRLARGLGFFALYGLLHTVVLVTACRLYAAATPFREVWGTRSGGHEAPGPAAVTGEPEPERERVRA